MNRGRGRSKRDILTIIAIVVGFVVVALSYATLSNTISISFSSAVKPDSSSFSVVLSSSSTSVVNNPVVPELNKTVADFTATDGTIDNSTDAPKLENMHVTFTEPGQSVTYKVYAHNTGKYLAYLNSINFSGSKTCTAKTGTSETMVAAACDGITYSVKVGDETATNTSVTDISGHELGKEANEEITIVITYETGSELADGDFDVTLPSVTLNYDSVDL